MWVRSAVWALALATLALTCGCGSEGDDDSSAAGAGTGGAAGSGGAGAGGAGAGGSAATGGAGAAGGATPTPSVDPTKDVESLDAAETAELCDWSVSLLGPGYGAMTACMGLNLVEQTWADQATCVRLLFIGKCEFTVAEWEACIIAEAPTKACVIPGDCADKVYCTPE